jgi:hypothetical protein
VVAEVREILPVSERATQKPDMLRFNLKRLNKMEGSHDSTDDVQILLDHGKQAKVQWLQEII